MKYYTQIRNVLLVVLLINLTVSFTRMFFGYSIHSSSMIADGVHALSDGLSNVVGLIGIWIASRPADEKFPYGYRKFETLAVLGIAVILGLGAIEVLRGVVARLMNGNQPEFSYLAFISLVITIVVNIGVVYFEKKFSKKYESDVLFADSEHTVSDLLISFSVVISLLAIKLGYPIVDAVVAVAIIVAIVRIAYTLVTHSSKILVDYNVINAREIEAIACSISGIKECHAVKTRGGRHDTFVDMHVRVDREMNIGDAHDLATKVEEKIKEQRGVTGVIVHVEPDASHESGSTHI